MLAGAPVRPNISLGDSVAGLHAAFGTVSWHRFLLLSIPFLNRNSVQVLALLARKKRKATGKIGGQTVDISIMERCARPLFLLLFLQSIDFAAVCSI